MGIPAITTGHKIPCEKLFGYEPEDNKIQGKSSRTRLDEFLSRNKETLSQRLSQNIKRVRAKVSPSILNEYFDKLATTLEGVPAENILNYDETNFTDDPESKTVIVRRGQKHVENVLDHSKSSFSVMFAGAADGALLPPYVVYASLHLYPTWTQGGPKGTRYNRSKSGKSFFFLLSQT